jgi:peptidoglycan/LPS O-acetylase OafA/YrhL
MFASNNMQAINNLRGIAILMIVFTHAIWIMPKVEPVGEFLDYYIGSGTIFFMFIAGYLFATQSENFNYKSYILNKISYVVLPYLIISFPAAMLYVTELKNYHAWVPMDWYHSLDPISRYLFITVRGAALGPLWFIPMIILFYVTSPIFLLIKKTHAIIPIALITLVIAWYIDRSSNNDNTFQAYAFFFPVYLIGIMAYKYNATLMKLLPYALPISVGYMAFFAIFYFVAFTPTNRPTSSDELVLYIPLILSLLLLASKYMNYRVLFLDMCARLSFFIFFIHGYFSGIFRVLLRRLGEDFSLTNPVLETGAIVGAGFAILFLSLACFVVLKLLTGSRSRYLIGA